MFFLFVLLKGLFFFFFFFGLHFLFWLNLLLRRQLMLYTCFFVQCILVNDNCCCWIKTLYHIDVIHIYILAYSLPFVKCIHSCWSLFSGADLSDADLRSADLSLANFTKVLYHLTMTSLYNVEIVSISNILLNPYDDVCLDFVHDLIKLLRNWWKLGRHGQFSFLFF